MKQVERRNLVLRGGVWYFSKVFLGRRFLQSTGQTDLKQARKKRDWFLDRLRENDVDALLGAQVKRRVCLVGALMAEYRRECRRRGEPEPATVDHNCNALARVIRDATGKDPEGMPATVLDKALLRDYLNAKLGELGDSATTRRTVLSTVTQARGVVLARLVQDYEVELPDLTEFRTYDLGKYPRKDVPLPPLELRLALMRAARRLWIDRDRLYLVYLMARHLGMRSEEMVMARWSWLEEHRGSVRMALRNRPEEGFRVKGVRLGNVPVSAAVLRRLRAFENGSVFILGCDAVTTRKDMVSREFARVMVELGWDKLDTTKRAHELRRLFGSAVWFRHGQKECHMRMRHCSFSTTEQNYLNLNLDLLPRELAGL
jgi:hypothetical protein